MDDAVRDSSDTAALNYNTYYETGCYDSRYPRPNERVLQVLDKTLNRVGAGAVIDFGCGNGRYLLPMLDMGSHRMTGFEICPQSLGTLEHRLNALGLEGRVQLVQEDFSALNRLHEGNPAAMAMMMFGVLSHIPERTQRMNTLRLLSNLLDPLHGRLVLSVPNRLRRFRELQRNGRDVIYHRNCNGRDISLFYHLYDPKTLRQDLEEAGFTVEKIMAESLLPESWITNNRLLGKIDGMLSNLIPACFGYGLLTVAVPKGATGA